MTEQGIKSESAPGEKPPFDGGTFSIDFLSDSPEGLQILTSQTLLRHSPNTPLPYAPRIRVERDREPRRFRVGEKFKPKVGARNVRQVDKNTLSIDVMPVTFPTYKAINSIEESDEALAISNPSATAGILLTTEADGSHNFILQHRSPSNYPYGDTPGASVAGYLDAKLDRQNRGHTLPIDTDYIKDSFKEELEQELGLDAGDLINLKIAGVASDRTRVHDEFLMLGTLNLTTEQLAHKVEERAKQERPDDDFDFEGSYFVIPADPEAIFKLLSEVQCPLPSTHAAAFIAAGYDLVTKRDGVENARAWLKNLEVAVRKNYSDIDRRVREYWMANTDKAVIKPPDRPERNLNGYDPSYVPEDQGLPNIDSEMKRTGLIS